MEEKKFEEIKNNLIKIVTDNKDKDLFSLVISIMKVVEEIKGLKGLEKKDLVVYSISQVLNADNDMKNLIESIIDNVISIDKGEIVINKKIKGLCCL
jgi:trans-2-enoyl-CoA reductase